MNLKKSVYASGLLVFTLLALPACSKESREPEANYRTETPIKSEGSISLTAEMAIPEELLTEAKAFSYKERASGKGIDFSFTPARESANGTLVVGGKKYTDDGDQLRAFLLVTKGGTSKAVEGTLWVLSYDAQNKKYLVHITANNPADLGDLTGATVAGVVGVSKLNDNGEATVPSPAELFERKEKSGELRDQYVVPMYFAPVALSKSGSDFSAKGIELKLYGSLVSIALRNTHQTKYTPREFSFKTSAFTTEGTMNLKDIGTNGPAWSTSQTKVTERKIVRIEQGELSKGTQKSFYAWVMPTGNVSGVDVEIRNNYTHSKNYSSTVTILDENANPQKIENRPDFIGDAQPDMLLKVQAPAGTDKMEYNRVHRLTTKVGDVPNPGDLIFIEVYKGLEANQYAWVLYNGADHSINLKDYKKVRHTAKGGTFEASLIQPNNRIFKVLAERSNWKGAGGHFSAPKATNSSYTLDPGEMVLYISDLVTLDATVNQVLTSSAGLRTYRPKLRYIFSINESEAATVRDPNLKQFREAFRAMSRQNIESPESHTLEKKNGEVVDAFFHFKNGTKIHVPSATFMRKPDRNMPRKYMTTRDNNDWVVRPATETVSWGRRYAYAWGSGETHEFIDSHGTKGSLFYRGYYVPRPIYYFFLSRGGAGRITYSKGDKNSHRYYPPLEWKSSVAKRDTRLG